MLSRDTEFPSNRQASQKVLLRKFPFPFRAALTICSDIDGTKTAEKFLSIQNFLNTERDTEMGPGLGLEIGNSFFPCTRDGSFSYLSPRPRDKALIRELIKAGYIDCLHSYEYGIQSRDDILRALNELERDGCRVDVWTNHSHAPSNFTAGAMPGSGDVPGSSFYHVDLTLAYGVRFVWLGRSTCLLGQEVPVTGKAWGQVYDAAHARETIGNMMRELGKILLAKAGSRKFAIHMKNRLLRVAQLQSGQQVYEFNRCNPLWSRQVPDSTGLSYMLQPRLLESVKASEGYTILYTHLGRGQHSPIIPPAAQSALRDLAASYHNGEIYVTTTSRLLRYCLIHRYLEWSYELSSDDHVDITIRQLADPLSGPRALTREDLQGITFYVPDRYRASVRLADTEISDLVRNPRDGTGHESVMIPRRALEYPLA